ncbi:MAG: hypothetical protein ABIG43_06610 [Chloroflexota bacterium]
MYNFDMLAKVQKHTQSSFFWLSRILIAVVLFWNLQAALLFITAPQDYAAVFELTGIPGETAVIGFGILFLMWQVPYFFALINPSKYMISLYEAIFMQAIGFIAESLLYSHLLPVHSVLKRSILRFIVFDGIGLLLLILARCLLLIKAKEAS